MNIKERDKMIEKEQERIEKAVEKLEQETEKRIKECDKCKKEIKNGMAFAIFFRENREVCLCEKCEDIEIKKTCIEAIKKMKKEIISCDKCKKEVKAVNYTQLDLSNKSLDGEFCDNCTNEFHEIALKFGFKDVDLVISVGDLLKTHKIKTVMDLYQFICNANGDDIEIFLETYGNRKLIDKNKNVVIFS